MLAVVAGTARHQPAHRVAHQHDLVDGNRPERLEPVQHVGQRLSVVRDVQPGVVAQVDGGEPVLVMQPLPVAPQILAGARRAPPRAFGEKQPVNEYGKATGGCRERRRHPVGGERHGRPVVPDLHAQRESVAVCRQLIPVQPVDRGDGCGDGGLGFERLVPVAAPRLRCQRAGYSGCPPNPAVHTAIDSAGHCVVDDLGGLRRRSYRAEDAACDTRVHVSYQRRQYARSLAAKVGDRPDLSCLHHAPLRTQSA